MTGHVVPGDDPNVPVVDDPDAEGADVAADEPVAPSPKNDTPPDEDFDG